MAGVYKGLTIKFDADVTGLNDALRSVDKQGKALQREMRQINSAMRFDPKNTELVRQKMATYSKEVANTQKRLETLKQAQMQLGKSKMSSQAWDTLQRDISKTDAKLKTLQADWQKFTIQTVAANSGLGKAGQKLEDTGRKLAPMAMAAQTIGRGLTMGITLPVAAAGGASIAAATNIDSALTRVKKTVNGTEEQYAALKDAAIEFSKTNAVSASQVLDIQALGAQLGFGITELEEFGRVVSGLQLSTNMTAEDAATQIAQFFNIMGTGHDKVSNFASTLVQLGNTSATTERDIMNMTMRIAGSGKTIGLSEQEVLALATSLSSVGIQAEMGGSAISTIMSQIGVDVDKGGKELEAWASAAKMSASEFQNAWKTDTFGTLQKFLTGLGDVAKDPNASLNLMLSDLGVESIRQLDTLKRLANASGMIPDIVKNANRGWNENVALANEVSNFNDSIAAKFEMVRNRLIAAGSDIGEPLADALLDLVNAAEPLFEMIENGARAFSEMSTGEQQLVVATVALIAAIGPALNLFGGIANNVEILGKAMKKSSELVTELGTKAVIAKGGMEALGTSTDKQIKSAGRLAIASNVAKGALVGLAIAGVTVLIAAIAKAIDNQKKFDNATRGLEGSLSALDSSLEKSSSSYSLSGRTAEEATNAQSELADSIKKSFTEVGTSAAMVDRYRDKIVELSGHVDGNKGKLAELTMAVDGYNSLTGASVEITDKESGALSISTEELNKNSDAWIANAKAKAVAKASEDTMAALVKNESDRDNARQKKDEAYAEAATNNPGNPEADAAYAKVVYWEKEEIRLGELIKANEKSLGDYQKAYEKYTDEAAWAADATKLYKEQLEQAGQKGDLLDKAAEKTGTSANDLAKRLHDAGMSAETFAHIGVDAFSALYAQAGMDVPRIIQMVTTLDQLSLDPKKISVKDDGSIYYEGQLLEDLNSMDLSDKTYKVNDDGTISTSDQELLALDLVRVGDKVYRVTDDGTGEQARKKAEEVNKEPIDNKNFFINAIDNASSVIGNIANALSNLPSQYGWNISLPGQNRAGGFLKLHASGGFITNGVTPLGRDANGIQHIAGEDGREWIQKHADGTTSIVPIENQRYLEPYASTIASMINPLQKVTNNNINIRLAVDAPADANQLVHDIERKLRRSKLMRG